jgi:hypothetical protein
LSFSRRTNLRSIPSLAIRRNSIYSAATARSPGSRIRSSIAGNPGNVTKRNIQHPPDQAEQVFDKRRDAARRKNVACIADPGPPRSRQI